MKTIELIGIILFISGTLYAQNNKLLSTKSCPYSLGEPSPVTSANDEFTRVKLSPNGKKILVTKHGYKGIYIIDPEDTSNVLQVTDEEKVGYNADWKQNGKEIRYKSRKKDISGEYMHYNVKTKDTKSSGKKLNNGVQQNEISFNINLKRNTVEATDGVKTWDVTTEPGAYYDCVISPDSTKVLIHKNDGNMYVYALDGSGLIANLGHGLCQCWTPDSQYLVYFASKDDGHTTFESDIYICSVNGKEKWQLTNTPDVIEFWPHISADGSKIGYYDLNSKKIFVTNLNKTKQ